MHIGHAHCCTSSFSVGVERNPGSPDKTQKLADSRFSKTCSLTVGNWQHNFSIASFFILVAANIPLHPNPLGMGDTTLNKSPLAAQKKSHVFSK